MDGFAVTGHLQVAQVLSKAARAATHAGAELVQGDRHETMRQLAWARRRIRTAMRLASLRD
jgi:methionine synthase II (cobalamin-independent)